MLDAYLERFGKLANATIDFPAMKEGHRSFREAYTKPTFKFGSYTTSTGALGSADIVINATPVGVAAFNGGGMLVAQAVASALIVSDVAEVKIPYSEAELFNLMADAAGFDCPRA